MHLKFDHGPSGSPAHFRDPVRLIEATDLAQVPNALAALDEACLQGHWLAGYASYELGYALEPCLHRRMPIDRHLPLLRFGVFERCESIAPQTHTNPVPLASLTPVWNDQQYRRAFDTVYDYIVAGDIYQANLTFPIKGRYEGNLDELYAALVHVQPVLYGAQVQQDGLPSILSRSPELFFKTTADGRIETRPMKGTQPRFESEEQDAIHKEFLATDLKNRAENLMIVDLMRNDLSRISEIGSVTAPELFHVESFATVHQMISLVQGQLLPEIYLGGILQAMFPCGSITGAPKIRSMEIINDLEPWPRDIYCGSIGWWAPDGRSEFNVAIRTLLIENGQLTMNVGGGIVYDSTAPAEYEEALWKARFATMLQKT